MSQIKFYSGEDIPLELHKVRVVQKQIGRAHV